ncbi:MAG TPA: hypothetical protein VNH20_06610 [Candidatus Dormibacteraeota bacterium]|nr:hypothetical protein [Candidatus Dormibacteraeota bacterium]
MPDIAGCRIVVQLPSDQDALVAALAARHQAWRVYDLRKESRFGYRAVHLVTQPPRPVELQVRTFVQQIWADTSERLDRLHEGIKYGTGPAALLKQLQRWSDRLAEFERSGDLTPSLILNRDAVVPIVVVMLQER